MVFKQSHVNTIFIYYSKKKKKNITRNLRQKNSLSNSIDPKEKEKQKSSSVKN